MERTELSDRQEDGARRSQVPAATPWSHRIEIGSRCLCTFMLDTSPSFQSISKYIDYIQRIFLSRCFRLPMVCLSDVDVCLDATYYTSICTIYCISTYRTIHSVLCRIPRSIDIDQARCISSRHFSLARKFCIFFSYFFLTLSSYRWTKSLGSIDLWCEFDNWRCDFLANDWACDQRAIVSAFGALMISGQRSMHGRARIVCVKSAYLIWQ